jgi:hypothetical protein
MTLNIHQTKKDNKLYYSTNFKVLHTNTLENVPNTHNNKSTAHECWTLDFFVSDIKLQSIYKVIHTSNYDGHITKYACKIGKYSQRGIMFFCNTNKVLHKGM